MALGKEFKEFAVKGNVVDMAVGIIIGGAFGTIVKSLVDDILMPPVGLLLGGVDFKDLFMVLRAGDPAPPYVTIADAQASGAVTVNYGQFINTVIEFLIVALTVFIVLTLPVLKGANFEPFAPGGLFGGFGSGVGIVGAGRKPDLEV